MCMFSWTRKRIKQVYLIENIHWKALFNKITHNVKIINKRNKNQSKKVNRIQLTGSTSEVLMYHGATEFVRILSFAHSQARFFVNWFIAADKKIQWMLLKSWLPIWQINHLEQLQQTKCYKTFSGCINSSRRQSHHTTNRWDKHNATISWRFKERMGKLGYVVGRFQICWHKPREFFGSIINSRLSYVSAGIIYLVQKKKNLIIIYSSNRHIIEKGHHPKSQSIDSINKCYKLNVPKIRSHQT